MKEKKGLVVLGIGAFVGSLFLLFRKKKPALAEPPPNGIVVGLWNPPKEAESWSLALTDWNRTVSIHEISGVDRLNIAEAAAFEIPSGIEFPLRIVSLQVSRWIEWEGTPALEHLYYVQSMNPYLWDFESGTWGDEPDPTYREAFMPDYGSYFYNVAKERFEKAG